MSQHTESALNTVLIDMARSFLQYAAECWLWVDPLAQSVEEQVNVIAARQRQDVTDIVTLLTEREHSIDFGSFPTEYTDLQFLALEALFDNLHRSQQSVCDSVAAALENVVDDAAATDLLKQIQVSQQEAATALREIDSQLKTPQASA